MMRLQKACLATSLLFSLLAVMPFVGTAGAQTITLKYSDLFPAQYPFGRLTQQYAEAIKKATNGQVQIEVFPSGALTPPAQCYEGVIQGLSDICQAVLAYTPGRFPLMSVIDLPGYPVNGHVTTQMANRIHDAFKPAEFNAVQILYFHAHPPGHLLTVDKVVKTLADLKGLRIRSTGLSAEIITALGAVPVSMPITQTYEPLRRKVVDGTDGSLNTLRYYRFAEVTNFSTQSNVVGYVSTFVVAMNKQKWDALSAEAKKAFQAVNAEFVQKAAELWNEIELDGYKFAKDKGHTFIALPADEEKRWQDAVLPVVRKSFLDKAKQAGVQGEQALALRDKLIGELKDKYPSILRN
jgi:TRAP-type C4-dicarboxylate transport system substrate-binding protein